jgi:hypothetical protein
MKRRALILITSMLLCMGCANISTLDRITVLPPRTGLGFVDGTGPKANEGRNDRSASASGLAIHLDAPQRLAFARQGFVCAEPSPDALQAYAQSFGFGLNIPGTASAEVAQALATSASSMGLRTQSITLMRDHLYRMCEASYNDQISTFDVAQLLRRSQDMTLGVLAIEQLTGAVVAQQVLMSSTANAHASANLTATKKELDSAVEDEKSAKEDFDKKKGEWEKLAGEATAAEEAYKKAPEGTEEEKTNKQTLQEKANTLKGQRDAAVKPMEAAKEKWETAQKVTRDVKANFYSAEAFAKATAEGSGKFVDNPYKTTADAALLASVGKNVRGIVWDIINKDHLRDSCISIMNGQAEAEENKNREEEKLSDAKKAQLLAATLLSRENEQKDKNSWIRTIFTLREIHNLIGKNIGLDLDKPSEHEVKELIPQAFSAANQAHEEAKEKVIKSTAKIGMYERLFNSCLRVLRAQPGKKDESDESKEGKTGKSAAR